MDISPSDVNEDLRSTDDCYFYFYSTCNKGDGCPFRHCEAALGTETVCSLWKQGHCFRKTCKYRHMESDKNRSSIPCYWESQPGGCRKPHCVFLHLKNKGTLDKIDAMENVIFPVVPDTANVPSPKTKSNSLDELSEDIEVQLASPVIEPVVVRFDDESDSEGCVGTPKKSSLMKHYSLSPQDHVITENKRRVISLKKVGNQGNKEFEFHIKSLEEIRKEKAQNTVIENKAAPLKTGQPDVHGYTEKKEIPDKLESDSRAINIQSSAKCCNKILSKAIEELKAQDSISEKIFGNHCESPLQSKPSLSLQSRLLPAKRKITIQSSENRDLNNIQVKTLEQIRAEKRMKLVNNDDFSDKLDNKSVVSTNHSPSESSGKTIAHAEKPVGDKELQSINTRVKRPAEIISSSKKIKLRCAISKPPADERKEVPVETFKVQEAVISTDTDQEGNKMDCSQETLVAGSSSRSENKMQEVEIINNESSQYSEVARLGRNPSSGKSSVEMQNCMYNISESQSERLNFDVENPHMMTKPALDEDLDLLFESEDVDIDDNVELRDDEVLRELDEAINT